MRNQKRKSKDRQSNNTMANDLHNITQRTKDRTPLKTAFEPTYSGRVASSCSIRMNDHGDK